MRFCTHCGNELAEDALFCTNCGKKYEEQPLEQPMSESMSVSTEQVVKSKGKNIFSNIFAAIKNISGKVAVFAIEKFNVIKNNKKYSIIAIAMAAFLAVIIALIIIFCALAGGYKTAVKNFVDYLYLGNANVVEKLAPDDYWDYMEDEYDFDIDDFIEDYEDTFDERIDDLEDEFGRNIKIKYNITDCNELSSKKFKTLTEKFKEKYGIPKKSVEKAYKVEVDVNIEGNDDEDDVELEFIVVKIDGEWYPCSEGYYFFVQG